MAKRIEYVDIAKGFSILLVVIYHMANQDYSNEYPFFVDKTPVPEITPSKNSPLYVLCLNLYLPSPL